MWSIFMVGLLRFFRFLITRVVYVGNLSIRCFLPEHTVARVGYSPTRAIRLAISAYFGWHPLMVVVIRPATLRDVPASCLFDEVELVLQLS